MTKHIVISRDQGSEHHTNTLRLSAERSMKALLAIGNSDNPLLFLSKLKFMPSGCDPLNLDRPLNFIEQLNQTFTYLATFQAADILFANHPDVSSLRLNLGTRSGWDIETDDDEGVIAEVFAATSPSSNDKLRKDIAKVLTAKERHKYVFFMCPGYEAGRITNAQHPEEVVVWSLGSPNQAL